MGVMMHKFCLKLSCSFAVLTALLSPAYAIPPITQTPIEMTSLPERPEVAQNGILHLKFWLHVGLGNRLKKMISYLRVYHPRHLNLYWDKEDWVTSSFLDLFSPQWGITVTEFNDPYLIENFAYPEPLWLYVNQNILLAAKDDFKDKQHRFIDTDYNDIPEEIIKIYKPWFENLHPSSKVQKRIDEVKLPQNAVAVQVRNAPDWDLALNGNEPLEKFYKEMDKYPQDTIFYLSTMSKDVALPFYRRYPNRIMELPDKDYSSMIDATADMFILGRTKEAIFSFGSSFSEIGWWLGGAKTKVTIVGSRENWQEKRPIMKLEILDRLPKAYR